ncbi:hypothetical protein G6F57_023828 [Rhizopus arrhizus]|nr:hypothetical protein G6F57_023828 [Rhizopus arrhizus]
MTAPTRSSPRTSSARWRNTARICADTSTGLRSPCAVRMRTMPGASTNSYGARVARASSSERPMKRFTDTTVFNGSSAC